MPAPGFVFVGSPIVRRDCTLLRKDHERDSCLNRYFLPNMLVLGMGRVSADSRRCSRPYMHHLKGDLCPNWQQSAKVFFPKLIEAGSGVSRILEVIFVRMSMRWWMLLHFVILDMSLTAHHL